MVLCTEMDVTKLDQLNVENMFQGYKKVMKNMLVVN